MICMIALGYFAIVSRLTGRYRRLTKHGKKSTVVITAIAWELVGFMWDIARRNMPTEEKLNSA